MTQQIHCENPIGLPMEDFSIVVDLNLAHPDGGDDTDDTEGFSIRKLKVGKTLK